MRTALAFALFTAPLLAQAPTLSHTGGALPGNTTWSVEAPAAAGNLYGIIVSTTEVSSEVLPGVFVDVGLANLPLTFSLPGFFGTLDANGKASATVALADPSMIGMTISSQALVGPLFDTPSNLDRTTPAMPGTFMTTLHDPILPIAGGAAAKDANGNLVFAGGSGPVAQRYLAGLEDFEDAGFSFGVGLLGASTALDDGRVLFTGGLDLSGNPTTAAAVWDPVAGTTTTVAMGTARAGHAATLMSDGRVMITGGFESVTIDLAAILADPLQLLSIFSGLVGTTEFFDPTALTFSAGPTMLEPRALHTATAISGGKVLVAGGLTLLPIVNIPTVSSTAYVYDPLLGIFGFPILFNGPRLAHSAILQNDGSVLLVGGLSIDLTDFILTGDITKLTVGSRDDILRYKSSFFGGGFSTAGTMSESRAGAGLGLMSNGDVLIAGGFRLALSADLTALDLGIADSADRYKQGSGVTGTGSLGTARIMPLVENLDDGTLLIVGGGALDAEVYQP